MTEKRWQHELKKNSDRIRVHFITDGKHVTAIIVVQYEASIGGKWRAIVRYDEAHGFFHQDVMLPTGQQEKTALEITDKNNALTKAIEDIVQNWLVYRRSYEEKYYDRK